MNYIEIIEDMNTILQTIYNNTINYENNAAYFQRHKLRKQIHKN